MKTAFVFSGQGAQYLGMGKEFYDTYASARAIFDQASEALDLDLAEICFNDEKNIHFTPYTQPAILTVSHAIAAVMGEEGIHPDCSAGLSLGEYSALVASEAIGFKEAVRLVHKRGSLMEEAVPDGEGKMAAVIGLDAEAVESICTTVTENNYVTVANYNTPSQLVLSGTAEGVEQAMKLAEERGAKRVVELNVSGPFHSQLLEPAAQEFSEVLFQQTFNPLTIPVYSNVTASAYPDSGAISHLLTKQMTSSVRFEQMIRIMAEDGVERFIEVGPGKTLKSFIKAIDRSFKPSNVEKPSQLNKLLEKSSG